MKLPALLPDTLSHYRNAFDDQALFEQMLKEPADLLSFFDYAIDDADWVAEHPSYMTLILEWFTHRHSLEKFSWELSLQIAQMIRPHYSLLSAYLPLNLSIDVEGNRYEINSLLFASACSYFRDLFHVEWVEKKKKEIVLEVSVEQFDAIREFVETGTVAALWRLSDKQIIGVLRKASIYGLLGLKELCEETLKRYVNKDNVLAFLKRSHKEGWTIVEGRCCEIVNKLGLGLHLDLLESRRAYYQEVGDKRPLRVEFFNFSDQALALFDQLKPLVTHLVCGSLLTQQKEFGELLLQCSELVGLDLSRSQDLSSYLFNAPSSLQELDLSQCSWLTDETLADLVLTYPNLERLVLASNTQLSLSGWAELQHLRQLVALDLSRCTQIGNEEMGLILRSAPHLHELSLEGCKKLSESAFFDLGRFLKNLVELNLSRTQLTGGALLDITSHQPQLRVLNLSKCRDLSEKAVQQAVKHLRHLQTLLS